MRPLSTNSIMNYIRRNATLPDDTEETFNEQDMLDMINEELCINMVKILQDVNEEYDVVDIDETVPTLAQNYSLKIPSRATANKLRAIKIVDSSNNLVDLHRVTLDNLSDYNGAGNVGNVFFVQGDEVKFPGGLSSASDNLRMYYHLAQSTLVPDDEVGIITAISAPYDKVVGADTVSVIDLTLNNIPTKFVTTICFDTVMSKTPNKPLKLDICPVAIVPATKTVTFLASDISSRLVVNDILAIAEETIYPSIPAEMHPLIAMAVAIRVCESQTDELAIKLNTERYEKMKTNILSLIDNRVEGSNLKFKMRYNTINGATGRGRGTNRTDGGLP